MSLPRLTLLLCVLLAGPCQSQASLQLQEILDSTSVTPPARIDFREERHNKMLKDPLILTGYLEYLGEGRLRKVVQTPFEESFLIDTDRIVIEQGGETRTLSLSKSRSLRTMLGGIEAVIAGQTERLTEAFSYTLDGTESAWSIALTPRSRRVAKQLEALLISGGDGSVRSIRFNLKDGEWHLLEMLAAGP